MNQTRIDQLEEQVKNIRQLQRNAMNMRNAQQFGRLERELESIYREIDKLKKA